MMVRSKTYFLNQLRIASFGRKLFFDAYISTATKPVVLILQGLNIIRRFYRLKASTNLYRVFPAYSRYCKYARTITPYLKSRGRIRMDYESLRLLNVNTPHSYYILETTQGIMTHKEAIKQRIGGLLLFIVH